jgi:glycerol transport system ATP-binding protein
VRVDGLRLAAAVPLGPTPDGEEVGLTFDPAQIHVYADSRRIEGTA